ncbi:hypothetical protein [Flagellimonas sp. CMM7]|uniref:hypothetical protein n=1 Tax=Flagellimonas sp. CMM7 TaxID=2654676 RepID=UPI0013D10B50|nr:hypothetical protein [Flagellimonas sp. CMM7]UII80108.1 hypothetical protein LV704_00970 [Flagellimonas sp. CMM7]
MLKGLSKVFVLVTGALLLNGCNTSVTSEAAFLQWLDNPSNGLIKKASANGFSLSLKYLPSEYLAYIEMKKGNDGRSQQDFLDDFKDSMSLLFSIEHNAHGIDATNYDVQNMVGYKQRINDLNFELKRHLFVKGQDGEKISPVLTTFENNYEVGGKKTFYIVFTNTNVDEEENKSIDIVFEDPFLDTGISHFVFKKKNIEEIPTLEFIN